MFHMQGLSGEILHTILSRHRACMLEVGKLVWREADSEEQ
jgi:hypothetical protein